MLGESRKRFTISVILEWNEFVIKIISLHNRTNPSRTAKNVPCLPYYCNTIYIAYYCSKLYNCTLLSGKSTSQTFGIVKRKWKELPLLQISIEYNLTHKDLKCPNCYGQVMCHNLSPLVKCQMLFSSNQLLMW